MAEENFTGDKKVPMKSMLADAEKRFIMANVGKFPKWIEGYHLTLMTIPWTIGLVVFGFLASRGSMHWLWGSSLMLALQWFTDSFDGALGRLRDTGIPKWGFYMDHFLDYLFMSGVFIGWTFFFEGTNNLYVWFMAMAMGSLMVLTLIRVTLLTHPAIGSQRLEFWTGNQTTWLVTPPGEGIEGNVGDTLSLIPLFEDALGVRTMNLAYCLQNEDLPQGPARGVSNVFTSSNVEVRLKSGSLVATQTAGRA